MYQDYHYKENPRTGFLQSNGSYAAKKQFQERNQFYTSSASIFPTDLDNQKRFNSEYRKRFFEPQPGAQEHRPDLTNKDGNIANPYLQKRRMGKKIIKNNPVYQKDTGGNDNTTHKPMKPLEQDFKKSVTEKFSQELQAQGYMKHSNKIPSLTPKYSPGRYDTSDVPPPVDQEQKPYKREAGRSLVKDSYQSNQNTSMEARNINRRIVENNIVRNNSVEVPRPSETTLREDRLEASNRYQNPDENRGDHRFEDFYQNPPQKPTFIEKTENYQNIDRFQQNNE